MDYTMDERCTKIIDTCLEIKETNPITIFKEIAQMDFIRIHGPEHHILDGSAILMAYYNAGGDINLKRSLTELMNRGKQMPGATCGMWGVCGAVSSVGAALSIIDGTGPLSTDSSWGEHMKYTSLALGKLAEIGGPRCCKRHAFLVIIEAIKYIDTHYNIRLDETDIKCEFAKYNEQCIGKICPFSEVN